MRVLSLGAGVQSSTVLLMMCRGELEPADCAIFADTHWEPQTVYDWLDDYLGPEAERAGIPIYEVTAGNIRADSLSEEHRFASMPLFLVGDEGGWSMGRRQCTREYKVAPIRRQIRELTSGKVELSLGISLDEAHRMRDSNVKYIRHHYPLIFDKEMRRSDCLKWLNDNGYPDSPRSACIGCPFHSDNEWRHLRDTSPTDWLDAIDFDHALRDGDYVRLKGEAYLHSSLKPLDEVTLKHEDQLDLWGNECEGMCGV